MRVEYDEIVIVDRLDRPKSTPTVERANGFGVRLEEQWFWFSDLEAAYTFGRAGRTSVQVRSWNLAEAATEARFDRDLGREVFTLYVVDHSGVEAGLGKGRKLIRRFADGASPRSAHWNA